ncbi:MAG: hypothetical protein Q7R57_02655, partial [Dehalococcoidales bacterium]|nr:hypothetical protein [Dehalococcoidales bacterium]
AGGDSVGAGEIVVGVVAVFAGAVAGWLVQDNSNKLEQTMLKITQVNRRFISIMPLSYPSSFINIFDSDGVVPPPEIPSS